MCVSECTHLAQYTVGFGETHSLNLDFLPICPDQAHLQLLNWEFSACYHSDHLSIVISQAYSEGKTTQD